MNISYEDISSSILGLEKKYNLFSLKQDDVYIWKMLRFPVMHNIIMNKNNLTSIHGSVSRKEKWMSSIDFLLYGLSANPFFIKKNTTRVIFENPRKVQLNGDFIDPYTHFFVDDTKDYKVIEDVYKYKHIKSVYQPASTTHFLKVAYKYNKFFSKRVYISEMNLNILSIIENEIEELLNVKVDVRKLAIKHYNIFKIYYKVYNSLFKRKKWKEIYIVCSYGKEALIAAAHSNNIKVIEFQHGVMGKYHLGYHFPEIKVVPYFPNEILLFGKYWEDATELPRNTKTIIYGYPYLNKVLSSLNSKIQHKNEKMVTVISQGTIGEKLSEIILKVSKELPDFQFQYKLHPGEFSRWRIEYPALVELSKLPNVTVYENEKALYEMLAESKSVIGVNSTAIFEGIAFNVIPLIIKLPGYEYMNQILETEGVNLFENPTEIISYLSDSQENNTINTDIKNHLFYSS